MLQSGAGDEIIGYITRAGACRCIGWTAPTWASTWRIPPFGRGGMVHRRKQGVSYMTDLQIKAFDRSGLISDITGVVFEAKLPVGNKCVSQQGQHGGS